MLFSVVIGVGVLLDLCCWFAYCVCVCLCLCLLFSLCCFIDLFTVRLLLCMIICLRSCFVLC